MIKWHEQNSPRESTTRENARKNTQRQRETRNEAIVVPRCFGSEFQNKMATNNNDQAVLESIFNPLLPLGDAAPKLQNENDVNEENTEDAMLAKQLEASGVEKAEQGDLDEALECFNQACEICPLRSSCFNNRAQLWRLKGNYGVHFVQSL